MQSTNNSNNYKINTTGEAGMSICIPRAFANINEARVRKVFDALNIFTIDRVDMVQRKNEKGDAYQRIFVHIKEWSETADARKAKERLLAGKELKIVYDDPWFWKASLNTWAPKPKQETAMYDRKPRIRLEFEDKDQDEEDLPYDVRWADEQARRKKYQAKKNAEAAAQLLNDATQEDRRPYRERRIDPVYCEQDVASGFRDRRLPRDRLPRKDEKKSRFTAKSPSRSPPRNETRNETRNENEIRDHRDGHAAAIYQNKDAEVIAPLQQYVCNKRFTVVHDVTGQKMTVDADEIVEVIEFNEAKDWAYIQNKHGMEDWFPSVYLTPALSVIAPALPEQKPVEEKKFVMNPDVKIMIATYLGRGITEITEEIYRNNAQFVRDLRRDEMDKQKQEDIENGIKPIDYRVDPKLPPKRRRGKIIE